MGLCIKLILSYIFPSVLITVFFNQKYEYAILFNNCVKLFSLPSAYTLVWYTLDRRLVHMGHRGRAPLKI